MTSVPLAHLIFVIFEQFATKDSAKSVKMFLEPGFEQRPHFTEYYKFENLKKFDYRLHF